MEVFKVLIALTATEKEAVEEAIQVDTMLFEYKIIF